MPNSCTRSRLVCSTCRRWRKHIARNSFRAASIADVVRATPSCLGGDLPHAKGGDGIQHRRVFAGHVSQPEFGLRMTRGYALHQPRKIVVDVTPLAFENRYE